MTFWVRCLFDATFGLIFLVLLSACSNAAVDKAVGTTDGASGIAVTRSESAVVVENRVGRPLLNVLATIEADAGTLFIHVLPTLDTAQKADLRFADFRTEDGALFDPAVAKPRQVLVTARDTLANNYSMTIPWEQ